MPYFKAIPPLKVILFIKSGARYFDNTIVNALFQAAAYRSAGKNMTEKPKIPRPKVIRHLPGGFTLFISALSISAIGILATLLVYSHFNYKRSQKKLFIEKWDTIAEKISNDASIAISDAGLIDDDFASYLYWIPALSQEIVSIQLVDTKNNPIYTTGSSEEIDGLIDKYTPGALLGDNQFFFPNGSGSLHTIIATPVYKNHKVEAVLLLTVNDTPEQIGIRSAMLKPVMLTCVLFIIWAAVIIITLGGMKSKFRVADKIQILTTNLANPGTDKSKTIVENGLKEIMETFSVTEGAVYLKNPVSGDFKCYADYHSSGKRAANRKSEDIDPGDPCLQSIAFNKSIIYDKATRRPISLEKTGKKNGEVGIALPLVVHSTVMGVLSLTFSGKKRLSPDSFLMLKQTAEIFSNSLFRALEMQEKTSDSDGLSYVLDLLKTASSTESLQSALGAVSEKIASVPGISFCSVFLLNERNKCLSLVAEAYSGEGSSRKPDDIIVGLDKMPIYKVALMSGQSQILPFDEYKKMELEKLNLLNPRMQDSTIHVIPLLAGNRRIGCLSIGTVESETIPYGKTGLFENMAFYLSPIISSLSQYSDMKGALEQLSNSHDMKLRLAKLEAISDLAVGISNNLDNTLQLFLEDIENLQILKDEETLSPILASIRDHMNIYRYVLDKFKTFSSANTAEKLHQIELAQVLKSVETRFNDPAGDGATIPPNILIVTRNSGSGQILGNENELLKAVLNIIINAVESMPYGGEITVESKIEDKMALLEISDHGSGMNEGEVKRVFDPFYTTKEGIARGLGLSIAYKIAVMHNGEIEVSSTPGRGSRFIIKIPLIDPEQTALYSSARKKSTGGTPLSTG